MANEHSNIVPDMKPTAKVADFKFWCQKVLPLVYDDSLSYYEVLNKVVVYLNQVIDNINADIDNVEELENDFLLLQSYVNNFFDDIDQLVTYTERAEAAQIAAAGSALNAASSATNAASSATNAATSATNAASSSLNAMNARDAAIAAKTAAESALANAQTAANSAEASATAASNSALSASGSATNAAASASAAQQSFTLADAARVAAQTAETNAEDSATDAAAYAADAETAAATADGAKAQAMIANAESATATAAHSKGDYFRIDGVLYQATADIQIGDTISTATNCHIAILADDVSAQSKAISDGLMALNLSDRVTAYVSGDIGQQISYQTSAASYTYKKIIDVKKEHRYLISIEYSDTVSSSNVRAFAIIDENNIIKQKLEIPTIENTVQTKEILASYDGFLCLTIDNQYVSLKIFDYGIIENLSQYNLTNDLLQAHTNSMFQSGINTRDIMIDKNRIKTNGRAASTGSTYTVLSIMSTNYTRFGGTLQDCINNVTPDMFVPISLANTYLLWLELDYKGKLLRNSGHGSGAIFVLTRNETTGVVKGATIGQYGLIYDTEKYIHIKANLLGELPEIYENQNILLLYSARYPDVSEELIVNIYTTNNSNTQSVSNILPTIAKQYPSFTALDKLYENDLVLIGSVLYKITTTINSGEQITPNTNATKTTIGEILTSLLNN